MEIVVGDGVRVLHGESQPELDVFAYRLAEGVVVGEVGDLERLHVQLGEALSLLLGDAQTAVDIDEVGEAAELGREAVGSTEDSDVTPSDDRRARAGRRRTAAAGPGRQHSGVEGVLQTVQRVDTAGVLEQ